MFSMISLGENIDESINNGRGQMTREKFKDTHVPNFKVRLYNLIGAREYELPTRDMLGVILYEAGSEAETDYDIVREERSRDLQRVNKLHPSYTSLQFPLVFIYGQDGYSKELRLIDIADIVDRVFKMKIHQFINYLRDVQPFGKTVLYTVEIQKREAFPIATCSYG
ncbi:hypothetical protein Tco_1035029 [Tanacetum coccineum]